MIRDTASSIAAHRDPSGTHIVDGRGNELLPVVGHHRKVDPGIDRRRAMPVRAAGHLPDRVPVAHHQAVETEPPLQDIADEMGVAVHLAPALAGRGVGEARVAHHHRLDVRLKRAVIACGMGPGEISFARSSLALVLTVERTAVAEPMLGRREHRGRRSKLTL